MGTRQSNSQHYRRPGRSLRAACAVAAIMGVVLAGMGAWGMDLTALGIGLSLTLVAVAGTRGFRALARIKSRLRETNERLEDLRAGISGAEFPVSQSLQTSQDGPGTPPIELISLGQGDPRVLTAATLDESTFPRLATLLNEAAVKSAADPYAAPEDNSDGASPTVVPTYDAANETEQQLRQEFSQRARRRDYAGLLDVGRRICELLPDRPIATEYERLEPALIRKAAAAQSDLNAREVQPSPGAIVFDHPRQASG